VHDQFHGDLLEVSMGPHPVDPRLFRMMVTLDGETIVKLKPVSATCIATTRSWARHHPISVPMPYTDRLDYELDDEQLGYAPPSRNLPASPCPSAPNTSASSSRAHEPPQSHLPRRLPPQDTGASARR